MGAGNFNLGRVFFELIDASDLPPLSFVIEPSFNSTVAWMPVIQVIGMPALLIIL